MTVSDTELLLFYTLYGSPLLTLVFSVFTGRILATDSSQSVTAADMKSSNHTLSLLSRGGLSSLN
jgi:hypothetical protein